MIYSYATELDTRVEKFLTRKFAQRNISVKKLREEGTAFYFAGEDAKDARNSFWPTHATSFASSLCI